MKRYPAEFIEQVLREVKEVGNVALVCRRHGLKHPTVHNWIHKTKNKGKIAEQRRNRELERKIKDQEHEILVLRSLLKKTFPLWNNEKPLS